MKIEEKKWITQEIIYLNHVFEYHYVNWMFFIFDKCNL